MLARVLLLAVALGVTNGEEKSYDLKTILQHIQPKEFKLLMKYHQDPSQNQEVQYHVPESHQQSAYTNSIVREVNEQQESQENTGLGDHPAQAVQYAPLQEVQLPHHAPQQLHRYAVPVHHENQLVHESHPVPHETQSVQHEGHPVHHESHPVHHESHPVHHESHPVHHESHPVYHVHAPAVHKVLAHHPVQPVLVHRVPVYQHKPESHSGESHEEPIDYYAHPKYQYEYNVDDPHTGDKKFQHEVRDGDVVKGVYSFHEADGSIRTVEYISDKHHGFNAVVKHTPPTRHHAHESQHH